jgi:hypothetical protein
MLLLEIDEVLGRCYGVWIGRLSLVDMAVVLLKVTLVEERTRRILQLEALRPAHCLRSEMALAERESVDVGNAQASWPVASSGFFVARSEMLDFERQHMCYERGLMAVIERMQDLQHVVMEEARHNVPRDLDLVHRPQLLLVVA